jgi:hypothetical protein
LGFKANGPSSPRAAGITNLGSEIGGGLITILDSLDEIPLILALECC